MSATTDYYLNKVKDLESNPVASYESKYQNALDTVLDKIQNRESFSYDFNADPLFQNYKDQYTKLGKEAAMNAAASVSSLTGGYGNSYAATAASQANQQYLTQLNEKIPELYNAALNKYQMDTDQLTTQYSTLGDAEDRSYNKYRDSVSDYNTALNYYQNAYGTQLSNDQWNTEQEYQKARDAVSDSQWQTELDYQKSRDAVSDDQWNKEYALSLASRNSGTSSGSTTTDKDKILSGSVTSKSFDDDTMSVLQNVYNNAATNGGYTNAYNTIANTVKSYADKQNLDLTANELADVINQIINNYNK